MALVCWSGGCDSTLVLYDRAQKASPQNPVRTISFDVSQISMGKEQARARTRILKWMRKKGLHVEPITVRIDSGEEGLNAHGNPQAVLWLLATQALQKKEDLYLGFVKKDAWWVEYATWAAVFSNLQTAADRKGALFTPLCSTTKRKVLKRLGGIGLLDLTWWCAATDLPKNKLRKEACGECLSCIDHETALWQEERFG